MQNCQAGRVDVDRNQALAQQYNIQAVPTLIILRPDGSEATRLEGFSSGGRLSHAMKDIRQRATTKRNHAGMQAADKIMKPVAR